MGWMSSPTWTRNDALAAAKQEISTAIADTHVSRSAWADVDIVARRREWSAEAAILTADGIYVVLLDVHTTRDVTVNSSTAPALEGWRYKLMHETDGPCLAHKLPAVVRAAWAPKLPPATDEYSQATRRRMGFTTKKK